LFAPFFNSLFAVPAHLHFISQVAFLIAAIDAACDVFFGFFESSVSARERFDAINMLNVSRMCLYALLTFLALNSGFGLLGVASATFAAKTVQRLGLIWLCNKYYSTKQIKIRLVSPSYFKDLLAYGRWSGLQQAAYRLLYRADSILAGALFGPIAAAVYAIPVIIIDQIRSLAESSNGLLAPRFAALHAEGKNAEISKLLLKWSRYSAFLALAIGVSIWITGQDFLALWMGSDFAQSSVILKILVAPFILVLPGVVFTYYLYATAQHRIASLLFALEAVLALTSSYILAHRHGIEGIALGTLAPAIIIRGLYIPFYVCRKLSISMLQYISHSILCLLPLFLTYCVALSLTQSVFPGTSWMGFLVSNTISAALLCTGYLAFLTDKEERSYLKRRLKVR
jgi:O-antigen/teichoic acid export membrane protein